MISSSHSSTAMISQTMPERPLREERTPYWVGGWVEEEELSR